MIGTLLRCIPCALAVLLAAGTTLAQERPVAEALVVRGAEAGCVDAPALAERLARWLGRRTLDRDIRVELVLRGGAPPSATLTLHRAGRPPAERAFPSLEGSCAARVDALALALAIALDPEAVSRRVEAEPLADPGGDSPRDRPDGGSAPVEPAAAPSPASDGAGEATDPAPGTGTRDPAGTPREPPDEPRFGIALGGGLAWGWLGRAAPLATLSFDARLHPALRLRVALLATGAPSVPLADASHRARLVGGELALRAGAQLGWLRLEGAAALVAAAFLARGDGFAEDLRTRRPWLALALGPRLELALTERWSLGLALDATLALLRARVHAMDPNGVLLDQATTPAAGLRLTLEVAALF